MCIDHGGADIAVAQQFLHGPNVRASLQKMCGERMAQSVNRHRLDNLRRCTGQLDGTLQAFFV